MLFNLLIKRNKTSQIRFQSLCRFFLAVEMHFLLSFLEEKFFREKTKQMTNLFLGEKIEVAKRGAEKGERIFCHISKTGEISIFHY
jgi:hypothetical protein